MQTVKPPRTFSQEGLAAECDVSRRSIERWISQGLISKAHGNNPKYAYYDDTHVAEIHALKAIRENNTELADLALYLREEGISLINYLKFRKHVLLAS